MILSKKTKHGLLSMGLAFGILTSSVVSPASVSVLASDYSARNVLSDAYIQSQFPAPISEENITSASVRSEALQLQSSKRAFDLDLSGQSFDGSGGIDYSKNAKYMDVLKNLKTTQNDQTIILRFKTSSDGLLFGAGSDALTTTGKNMTVSIRDGKLRLVMRNTKKADGAPAGGLKGSFNVSLADGNWHTVAISFLPSLNYVNDNVRIAVDGTDLNYASNTWGSSWKAGFNQGAGADYNLLQIGGGSYVGVNNNDYASANFNGKIDFITVIDKAYSMDDLKSSPTNRSARSLPNSMPCVRAEPARHGSSPAVQRRLPILKTPLPSVTGLGFLRIPCAAAAAILKEDVSYSIQPVAVPMLLLFLQITTDRSMLTTRRQ